MINLKTMIMQLIDNETSGIRICRIEGESLVTVIVPRDRLAEAKKLPELPYRGIYYLLDEDHGVLSRVYAGQTTQGISRLEAHKAKKEFWNKAVMFLDDDNNIDRDVLDDTAYMNANFEKWLKRLAAGESEADLDAMLDELHASFATLDQEQQRYAEMVIQAAQGYDLAVDPGKTFMDYINEFQAKGKAGQVKALVDTLGIDEGKLRTLMAQHVTEANINEFGRLDALKKTADMKRAGEFFAKREGKPVAPFKVSIMLDKLLRDFVLSGGLDVDMQVVGDVK